MVSDMPMPWTCSDKADEPESGGKLVLTLFVHSVPILCPAHRACGSHMNTCQWTLMLLSG